MPLSIYSIYLNESKNLRHTLITLGTFIKAQIMSFNSSSKPFQSPVVRGVSARGSQVHRLLHPAGEAGRGVEQEV